MSEEKEGISIKIYRLSRWFYTHHMRVLARLFYAINYVLTNCVVPPSAQIDKEVSFAHSVGIVIHHNATIGSGTKIYQNSTIGGGTITIGKNCYIGTGAVVLRNIGNNVKVGANSVVLDTIPDNCTVVGAPARIVNQA